MVADARVITVKRHTAACFSTIASESLTEAHTFVTLCESSSKNRCARPAMRGSESCRHRAMRAIWPFTCGRTDPSHAVP